MSAKRWVNTAIVIAIVAIIVLVGYGWRSCARSGGTYVRGLVWMVCVR